VIEAGKSRLLGGLSHMQIRFMSGCGLAAVAIVLASPAVAQVRTLDIPAQSLPSAIAALGKQARLQIVAPADGLETVRSHPVKGAMAPRVALRRLIGGTGLEIASDDGARIVLRRATRQVGNDASTVPAAGEQQAGGEIVVTGYRASLRTAREIKRRSDAIVDSVAAEDIGQLPDNSATEALARLPGVQVFRNRGEGQAITIRGIANVVTMVNGQEGYTGASRRTLLNSYPAGLIRSLSVYKALTPDLIEGGIGGAVDVQLRQPLDFKPGLTIAGTLRGSYDDQADKGFGNADVLVAGNWNTGIGKIGVMINASYLKRDYYEIYRESLQPQTNRAGQILPTGILLKNPKGNYKRPVITGELQWRPTDNLGMHLRVTNVTDDNEYTDADLQTNMAVTTPLSNVTLVPGTNIVKSATFTATADSGPRSNYTRQLLDTTQVEFGADYSAGIATLTTSAVYTTSRINTDQQLFLLSFNKAPVIDAVFQSDSKFGGLSYTYRDVDLSNIGGFHVRAYSDTRTRQKGDGVQWRTDLNLDTGTGFFRSLKTGFRYATRSAESRTGTGLADLNRLNLPMSAFPGGTTPVSLTRGVSADDVTLPSGWVGYDASQLADMGNVKTLNAYVDSLLTTKLFTNDGRPADTQQSAFDGNETSYAVYGQFKYGFDLGGVAVDGVAGLRVVNTKLDIDGTQYAATRAVAGGPIAYTYTPVAGQQNYLDVDPSVSAVAHFTPALQLRLAWTKTFSRPDFAQLNPSQTFSQTFNASGYNGQVTSGNPDLLPIRSTNWDASLEAYFGRAGLASAALFSREVSNYIVNVVQPDATIPGALGIVNVTQPINAGDGLIKGAEVSLSTFFDFAPGPLRNFGVSGNYTYVDSKQDLPATSASAAFSGQTAGISKHSYNSSIFYDDGNFRATVGYSWRGRFTLNYNLTDPTKNLNWYPIERLAASATYKFGRNLSLTLDATNVTNRPQRAYWGSQDVQDRVYFEGRTYSAAVRFKY
jgi:iron complex outermembrane receptor protein